MARSKSTSNLLHLSKYSWLSLSQILDVSNFALSLTIYPVPWSFSTWSKQKNLVSRISIFLPVSNKFSDPLSSLLKLAFFQLPRAQLLQLYQQEWVKTLNLNVFAFFFFSLIECFDSIFWSLDYPIKVLLFLCKTGEPSMSTLNKLKYIKNLCKKNLGRLRQCHVTDFFRKL